jgi:hypothetical protein
VYNSKHAAIAILSKPDVSCLQPSGCVNPQAAGQGTARVCRQGPLIFFIAWREKIVKRDFEGDRSL